MIITIDCGTTNMRARLFDGARLVDEVKMQVGTRNAAFSGSADVLRTALRDAVCELLAKTSVSKDEVEIIVSAGTLSSDVGIYRVPHVKAPVGAYESAAASKRVTLEDISEIPILFIPGVRTAPPDGEARPEMIIKHFDSMSGEECETYGTMSLLGIEGDFVITLPGSYTKTMEVDSQGRITSIRTGMCGEFIAAMSEHTLLKKFLPHPPIRRIIPEKLIEGFDYCAREGVSPTLIKARNIQVWAGWDEDDAANFFVGAILLDDIRLTLEVYEEGKRVILGGGEPLRSIFELLLLHAGVRREDLVTVDDETARLSSNLGAIKVYGIFKEING